MSILNVVTYGATGDGVTDDTAAFQSALNQLVQGTSVGNHTIYIPKGIYKITSTLLPPNSASYFTMVGDGKMSSQLKWYGSVGIPMLKLVNSRGSVFANFAMFGGISSNAPSCGIQVHRGSGLVGSAAPKGATFTNIFIGNYNGESIDNGIIYTADSGYDSNNEQGVFDNIEIANANYYGLSFEHSNSLWHKIYGGSIGGKVAAINNVGTAGVKGGSYQVYGTALSTIATGYLFRLGLANHAISVFGGTAESAGGLITTPYTMVGTNFSFHLIGGSYILSNNDPTVLFDGSGVSLYLTDVTLTQGVSWEFPTTGSYVVMENMTTTTTTMTYNNNVYINNCYNGSGTGAFTLTNSGSGSLNITNGKGSFDGVGNKQIFTANSTTPSVDGWDYFEANYSSPTTITDFLNGFPGKEFTLYVFSANQITIANNSSIRTKSGADYLVVTRSFLKFRKVSAPYGSYWYEV